MVVCTVFNACVDLQLCTHEKQYFAHCKHCGSRGVIFSALLPVMDICAASACNSYRRKYISSKQAITSLVQFRAQLSWGLGPLYPYEMKRKIETTQLHALSFLTLQDRQVSELFYRLSGHQLCTYVLFDHFTDVFSRMIPNDTKGQHLRFFHVRFQGMQIHNLLCNVL